MNDLPKELAKFELTNFHDSMRGVLSKLQLAATKPFYYNQI